MVAEPVTATLDALSYYYDKASGFVDSKTQSLQTIEILKYLPITVHHTPESLPHELSIFEKLVQHKGKATIFTVGIGMVATYCYFNPLSGKLGTKSVVSGPKPKYKRRVPKLPNGARLDVVLVVGSPTQPLTRLIALDFERRGFIVYLTILDEKDMKYTESNPITDDINYLNMNDAYSYENQLARFNQLLQIPVVPFPGAEPHNLRLRGVVFAPNLHYPIGPMENITIASWNRVTDWISVYTKLFASGLIQLIRSQNAKTIVVTPNITSSLHLPYHAPETFVQTAIQSLFSTLTKEIRQHKLSVTQVRLGNISVLPVSNSSLKTSSIINSEIKGWSEDMKSLYCKSFTRSQFKSNPIKSTGRGTNLRELYHTLFDLIYSRKLNPEVVYCGTGARTYDYISYFLPTRLIMWMLS